MGDNKTSKTRVARGKKQCTKCRIIKSKDKFPKDKRAPDGLNYICKDCRRAYNTTYQKLRRGGKPKVTNIRAAGIDSWNQIDSVLRELSESQYKINTENALCQERKALIDKYSQEITEPLVAHQIGLQTILIDFLKKNLVEAQRVRKCRFGSVCFMLGKLELTLKPALAGKLIGKP